MTQDKRTARSHFRVAATIPTLVIAAVLPVSAAKKQPQVVPETLVGEWSTDPETCKQHYAEGRLTVEGNFMKFHASGYDVRQVTKLPDGSTKLSGLQSHEGGDTGRARASIRLRMLSSDRFELIEHPEGQFYERCKTSPR